MSQTLSELWVQDINYWYLIFSPFTWSRLHARWFHEKIEMSKTPRSNEQLKKWDGNTCEIRQKFCNLVFFERPFATPKFFCWPAFDDLHLFIYCCVFASQSEHSLCQSQVRKRNTPVVICLIPFPIFINIGNLLFGNVELQRCFMLSEGLKRGQRVNTY